MYARILPALTLAAVFGLLCGCAAPAPLLGQGAQPAARAATAQRHLQLIADPAIILSSLPTDLEEADVDAPPAPADPAAVQQWERPLEQWRDAARRASQLDGQDAGDAQVASEALEAVLSDGLILADAARAHGHPVSDDAVLAEAAWRIIAQQHPLRADEARADAEVAAWSGYWSGEATAPGVITGRLLGAAVAEAAIAQSHRVAAPTLLAGDH